MADGKPPRPPGSGGFGDLIDQLRAFPDDLRDAVGEALEGDGASRVAGIDLLLVLMRAQGFTAQDFAQAMPPLPPPAPIVPSAPPPTPSHAQVAVGPAAPPPPGPAVPAAQAVAPPPPPPAAPAPLGGATPLGSQVPPPGQPPPPLNQVLQNIPMPPGSPQSPPLAPPPPSQQSPTFDQFLQATLQPMPHPVAQGFGEALKQTEPWKRAGQVFGDIADAAGFALEAGALRGAAAAAGPVGFGLGLAYASARYVADADDRAEAQNATNRPFAQTNAAIANSFMQLQMGDIRCNFELGERVEASAAHLAGAVDRMRSSWQDFNAFAQNASNRGASFSAGLSAGVGQFVSPFANAVDYIMGGLDPDGSFGDRLSKVMGENLLPSLATAMSPGLGFVTIAVQKALESMGFGGDNEPAERFVQGWHQELANIMGGSQTRRGDWTRKPRPGGRGRN